MMYSQDRKIHPLIVLASLIVTVACLYWAESLLKPLALAILLTFLLNPLVGILQRTGLKRVPAVIITSVLAFSILGVLGWAITHQIKDFANDLPKYKQNITQKVVDFRMARKDSTLEKVQDTVNEVIEDVQKEEKVTKSSHKKKVVRKEEEPVPVVLRPSGFGQIPTVIGPLLGPIGNAGLVIVFVIFMLSQLQELRNRLIRLVGYKRLTITTKALDEAGERVSRYLFTQLLLNTGHGIAVGVMLFFIGIPYALVLGFICGFLRFIPYLGPWLGAILPITISLAVFDGWIQPLITVGFLIIFELINNMVLEPLLYGHSAGVGEFPLLVAIAFWTWLWGPIGLLLATPLTVCLVVLGKYIPGLEFIPILLGDEPIMEPHVNYYQRLLAKDQDEAIQIVDEYLKTHPLEQIYDEIFVPSLCHMKRDRRHDKLDEEDEQYILQATREILKDLEIRQTETLSKEMGKNAKKEKSESSFSKILVLGYPARDEADELALLMFRQLESDRHIEIIPYKSLFSEVISHVEEKKPSAICIASLPPDPLSHVRLFAKRLKNQFPNLGVFIGRWGTKGSIDEVWRTFFSTLVDHLGTTIVQTREYVHQLANLNQETYSKIESESKREVTLKHS